MTNRLQARLPMLYRRIGCKSEFEEDKLATWLQNASNALKGLRDTRDRTQGKSANHGVNGSIRQRDALSGKIEKLDVEFRSPALPFGEPAHPQVRLQRIELAHFRGIVVPEIQTGPCTDLKDLPVRERDDQLANDLDGWRIAQPIYEIGIDTIAIKSHTQAIITPVPLDDNLGTRKPRNVTKTAKAVTKGHERTRNSRKET